jgi:hypothetical protein
MAANLIAILSLIVQGGMLWAVIKYTRVTSELFSLQTHQGFENKFFQLLRFHHDIVDAIQVRLPPGGVASHHLPQPPQGRPAFSVLYQRLTEKYDAAQKQHPGAAAGLLAVEAYDRFFEEHQDPMGHYFRNLYQIIKFIDRSDEGTKDKDFYAHLVRAQMSSHELLLLFYDGTSQYGKDKFYPLIEKYAFLENMPQGDLISRRLKLLDDDKNLYHPRAFGKS